MGWLGEGLAKRSHTAPMSVGLLLLSSSRSPPQPSIPSTTSSPNPPRPPTPLTPRRTLAPPTEEWSLGPPVHEAELGLLAIAPAMYTLFHSPYPCGSLFVIRQGHVCGAYPSLKMMRTSRRCCAGTGPASSSASSTPLCWSLAGCWWQTPTRPANTCVPTSRCASSRGGGE